MNDHPLFTRPRIIRLLCACVFPCAIWFLARIAAAPLATIAQGPEPPPPPSVGYAGSIGGEIYTTARYESQDGQVYACVGEGYGLTILDMQNPKNPTRLARLLLEGPIKDIHIVGTYAYVADTVGVKVVNISNPASPILTGKYATPGNANGVFVDGQYAYIADGVDGAICDQGCYLHIVDISDPASIPTKPVAKVEFLKSVYDVYIHQGYAYVANGSRGVQIVDISTPTSPQKKAPSYDTTGSAKSIQVVDTTAYIADGSGGMHIVDMSNPEAPAHISTYDEIATVNHVHVEGQYAYIAAGSDGVKIVDISTPNDPTLARTYATRGQARHVTIAVGHAYVASDQDGLDVVDIRPVPLNPPSLVGRYSPPRTVEDMHVVGQHAYVAAGLEGLRVIDISDPAMPKALAHYDTLGNATAVYVEDDYAYIADGSAGMQIINISTPHFPTFTGNYNPEMQIRDVYVKQSYAYVAAWNNAGLHVVDIQNLETPMNKKSVPTGKANSVYVAGTYAYVATDEYGLRIVDISSPSTPTLVGDGYDTTGTAEDVFVVGNYAYVADGDSGVQIVDISTPDEPTLAGTYDTAGKAMAIRVVDNYAFVADADEEGGLLVLDVSSKASPSLMTRYKTPASTNSIYVALVNDMVYLANTDGGMQVLHGTNLPEPTPTPTFTPEPTNTPMPTSTPTPVFEPNNECIESKSIDPDGTLQRHNFYQENDEDWIKFDAIPGTTYFIYVRVPSSSSADVVLQIYKSCDNTQDPVKYKPAQDIITYPVHASSSNLDKQPIFLKLVNVDSNGAAKDVTYDIAVSPITQTTGDVYEIDNKCSYARRIKTDGTPQQHTFHHADDDDWVRFDVIAGKQYVLEIHPVEGSSVDIVPLFYEGNCNTPIEDEKLGTSTTIKINYIAPINGHVYVHLSSKTSSLLTNEEPNKTSEELTYSLSVRESVPPQIGALILVAGSLEDKSQANINNVARNVYDVFTKHNYTDDNIQFLAVNDNDKGCMGLKDAGLGSIITEDKCKQLDKAIDGAPTRENLKDAITVWAKNTANVGPGKPLTIYMIDHGNNSTYGNSSDDDGFYLDGTTEMVSFQEINDWLTELEEDTPGLLVNVIVEACFSGGFIHNIQQHNQARRVVVTSTSHDSSAYVSSDGAFFSDTFLRELDQGNSILAAFETAKSAVLANNKGQKPWLDDNGDGQSNRIDSIEAAKRGFSSPGTLIPDTFGINDVVQIPHITIAYPKWDNQRQKVTINANVEAPYVNNRHVDKVWMRLFAPSQEQSQQSETLKETTSHPINMSQTDDTTWYVDYDKFDEQGIYRVVVYAEDTIGKEARPFELILPVSSPGVTLASNNTVDLGKTTYFTLTVADNIIANSVEWDFGDGSEYKTTSGMSVSHTYERAGTYNVIATISVSTHDKQTALASEQTLVGVAQVTINPPDLMLVSSSPTQLGQRTVFMSGVGNNFTIQDQHQLEIDYGDGTQPKQLDANKDDMIYHQYKKAGLYLASLRLSSSTDGHSEPIAETTIPIAVAPPSLVLGHSTPTLPNKTTFFTATLTNLSIEEGTLEINFDDNTDTLTKTVLAPGGLPQTFQHTYPTTDTYTAVARLTSDEYGDTHGVVIEDTKVLSVTHAPAKLLTTTAWLSTDTYHVDENAGYATITVTLQTALDRLVQVDYEIDNSLSTAKKDEDYEQPSPSVAFAKGVLNSTLTIPIINEEGEQCRDESPEMIHLKLKDASEGVEIIEPSQATLQIHDPKPSSIDIVAYPTKLQPNDTTTVTVTVLDRHGRGVPCQQVTLETKDNDRDTFKEFGSVGYNLSTTTDTDGKVTVQLHSEVELEEDTASFKTDLIAKTGSLSDMVLMLWEPQSTPPTETPPPEDRGLNVYLPLVRR